MLYLDIETSPNIILDWDLRNQGPRDISMLLQPGSILCFGYKAGEDKTKFAGVNTMEHEEMTWLAHQLLTETDVVVGYNSDGFDLPWLNAAFMNYKMPPPAPYRSLDLYKVAKKFRLPSRKLGYVSKVMGFEGKAQHSGMQMWRDILFGTDEVSKRAWREMKKYNIQDVDLLPPMVEDLRPWLPTWFNYGLYRATPEDVCKWCGSPELTKRGLVTLSAGRYQQFNCRECGGWMRSSKRTDGNTIR